MNVDGERMTPDDFNHLFTRFERLAFRLEVQPRYTVDWEAAAYAAFLAGEGSQALRDLPEYAGWLDDIRKATTGGRRIQRVRVLDDPPTDYQRWELDACRWNIEAGEEIATVDRDVAYAAGLPLAYDWWLFDDTALAWMRFDSEGVPQGGYVVSDHDTILRHCAWRDLAVRISTPV